MKISHCKRLNLSIFLQSFYKKPLFDGFLFS
ncbi:hypothetical protein MHA_2425 [Mannheimia haemolytica PHL213]|nr:hypothetical protein MHA_2425 [Mannheimia haemolytica PHL213]